MRPMANGAVRAPGSFVRRYGLKNVGKSGRGQSGKSGQELESRAVWVTRSARQEKKHLATVKSKETLCWLEIKQKEKQRSGRRGRNALEVLESLLAQ